MNNVELYKNYLKSLEQKYNAACFDVDGTLTIEGSKFIDDRAIKIIIDLLKRKVPVVFITGRGETGLQDLKNDIYDRIKNNNDVTDNDIKRIYVLTNDGARLFYSDSAEKCDFLSKDAYISTEDEFKQLNVINDYIINMYDKYKPNDFFQVTYSKDNKTNNILNIRIVFNEKNSAMIDSVIDDLEKYIIKSELKGIYLTRGEYTNKSVIQIGTATKDKAIERTEKIIGVPQNSMIRIGDCGDLRGNDFAMLNCNQGYSVDKTSDSINSCFPVFDKNGKIIKGVDATLQLINSAHILPTVCLEKADKKRYQHQMASVESGIVLGRKKLLKKYNDIININFNNFNGIDDLFDKSSGSVIIPMYEIELLENSPLKDFWLSTDNNKLIYSIRDDNNYLLRGSSTYYYFMSNRISINGKDITSKNDVIKWYNNYIKFLNDSVYAVSLTKDLTNQTNKKLLLGILDNCRNTLLILLNHYLVSNYYDKNIILDISSDKEKQCVEIYKSLIEVEKIMSSICFNTYYTIKNESMLEVINRVKNVLINNLTIELNKESKEDYSKDYRTYREIDNFAENYIAVSLYKDKCNNKGNVNACGLSYGGIELPLLAKIIDQNRIEKLLLLKFSKRVCGYTNKQLIDLRKFNINNFNGLINAENFVDNNIDLFDDNVLTGKTLQLAINSLYDCNINVKNICIVRYPSINRIDQMFLDNPSAVDYNLFFDYIYGLCFSSPYSWKDDNWKNKSGEVDYTDALGVFDLNRKKIIECLLKNHDYNENSEVGEYKRRLLK